MRTRNTLRRGGTAAAIGLALAVLASCGGGSGEGLDANGRPLTENGGTSTKLQPTFASIQANVLTPICVGCHAGAAAPAGLRLDESSSYALLVGVASAEAGSLKRVAPGNPGDSYIIQKLEGRAAVGARMPLGGPYLDQATIDVIRQWIANGAARDGQP